MDLDELAVDQCTCTELRRCPLHDGHGAALAELDKEHGDGK